MEWSPLRHFDDSTLVTSAIAESYHPLDAMVSTVHSEVGVLHPFDSGMHPPELNCGEVHGQLSNRSDQLYLE